MKTCRMCGSTNDEMSKFCPNCGAPLNIAENTQTNPNLVQNSNLNRGYTQVNYYNNGNIKANEVNQKKSKFSKKQAIVLSIIVAVLLIIAIVVVAFKMIFNVFNPLNKIEEEINNYENVFDDYIYDYDDIFDDYIYNYDNDYTYDKDYESEKDEYDISNVKNNSLYKNVEGDWVTLANECYRFEENGTFYWYKSYYEKNDNYYRGTFDVMNSTEAVDELEIEYSAVLDLISRTNGAIGYEDIYCIKAYPTYILSGGIDKTETNLNDDTCFWFLFIKTSDDSAQMYNYVADSKVDLMRK